MIIKHLGPYRAIYWGFWGGSVLRIYKAEGARFGIRNWSFLSIFGS